MPKLDETLVALDEILAPWTQLIHSEYDGTSQLNSQLQTILKAKDAINSLYSDRLSGSNSERTHYVANEYAYKPMIKPVNA